MKVKVIDLLNKIANGEIPEKIKFIGKIWEYDDSVNDYSYFLIDHYEYFLNNISFSYINDEIEIIEDKKIEKLESLNTDYFMERKKYGTLTNEEIVLDIQTLKNYINMLVDKENGE